MLLSAFAGWSVGTWLEPYVFYHLLCRSGAVEGLFRCIKTVAPSGSAPLIYAVTAVRIVDYALAVALGVGVGWFVRSRRMACAAIASLSAIVGEEVYLRLLHGASIPAAPAGWAVVVVANAMAFALTMLAASWVGGNLLREAG